MVTIYTKEGCAPCNRVKAFIKNRGIKVMMVDVEMVSFASLPRMKSVPTLVHKGVVISESLDIIKYLAENDA